MHTKPTDMPVALDQGGVEIRGVECGDMVLAQFTLAPGTDLTPFFAALPDGLCSGQHWGTVLQGEIHVRYADESVETTSAGEHFYWPAGHTAWTDDGVVFLAVTPLREEQEMAARMAAAQS